MALNLLFILASKFAADHFFNRWEEYIMKKLSALFALSCLFSALLITAPAHANLLTNGNFDANLAGYPTTAGGTGWGVYASIPGWTAYIGAGIEVQQTGAVQGVVAHSANQYVELDSHPASNSNSGMKQDVYLSTGWYDFDFYYQPRTGTTNDNGITYGILNLYNWPIDGVIPPSGWRPVSQQFQITADGNYSVYFSAFGIENTLGGFIDTVSLASVPEPGTLLFLGLGLLSVVGIRRFRK